MVETDRAAATNWQAVHMAQDRLTQPCSNTLKTFLDVENVSFSLLAGLGFWAAVFACGIDF